MNMNISFTEVVNAVSNGTRYIKKHYANNNCSVKINVSEFKVDTYENETLVLTHIPTGAKVRAKILHPFSDTKVEKLEVMPKGKKRYTYITDYVMFEDQPEEYTMMEVFFKKSKKVDSFDIDNLLWTL